MTGRGGGRGGAKEGVTAGPAFPEGGAQRAAGSPRLGSAGGCVGSSRDLPPSLLPVSVPALTGRFGIAAAAAAALVTWRDVWAEHYRSHHGGAAQRDRLGGLQDGLQGHHARSDGPQEEAPRLFNTVHK